MGVMENCVPEVRKVDDLMLNILTPNYTKETLAAMSRPSVTRAVPRTLATAVVL